MVYRDRFWHMAKGMTVEMVGGVESISGRIFLELFGEKANVVYPDGSLDPCYPLIVIPATFQYDG